jgi:hypothetical protein
MVSCSFCLVFKYRSLWTLNTAVIADAYFCGVSILGTLQVPCGRASATGNTILYPTLLIPKTVVALFHFRWWMLLLKRCCCCEYKLLFEPGCCQLTPTERVKASVLTPSEEAKFITCLNEMGTCGFSLTWLQLKMKVGSLVQNGRETPFNP